MLDQLRFWMIATQRRHPNFYLLGVAMILELFALALAAVFREGVPWFQFFIIAVVLFGIAVRRAILRRRPR